METVAVYSEPRIRTYGFDLREGLYLFEVVVPDDPSCARDTAWQHLLSGSGRFEWMTAVGGQQEAPVLWLLCDAANAQIVKTLMDTGPEHLASLPERVDLIHFQGPHFGDRWGIAHQTLAAVAGGDAGLLAMTCTVAGIHLVFAQGRGRPAKDVLAAVFEVPQKVHAPVSLPGRPHEEGP